MEATISEPQTAASNIKTYFASPERIHGEELVRLSRTVSDDPVVQVVLKSIGGFVMILNEHRQIMAASPELYEALDIQKYEELIGFRPGEVLNCVHHSSAPSGCGTGSACRHCGAVLAILASQQSEDGITGECSMMMNGGHGLECVEFRVQVTPLPVNSHKLQVFILQDISSEKRRETLERIFFHDLRNTLGGLLGLAQVLQRSSKPEQIAESIVTLAQKLAQEINNQQLLLMAEQGEITIEPDFVRVSDAMNSIRNIYSNHEVTHGKKLIISKISNQSLVYTDLALLTLVLSNMVKNALEASQTGDTVHLRYEQRNGKDIFLVHNAGYIPQDIALQIFQRTFSTKQQSGRGLGTYSMKLFGETYLNGQVDFETSEKDGTTFFIALPLLTP